MKIFISHCGLGGVVEAKFHGVVSFHLIKYLNKMSEVNIFSNDLANHRNGIVW
jgi:hypothetical protein